MFNQGHSGTPSGIALELIREPTSGLTFEVSNIDPSDGVLWDEVWMKLVATPTDPNASYTYRYWEWHPSTDLLTNQNGAVIQSINSYGSTSPWQIVCNVTDIAGNGNVNDGDYFILYVVGSEAAIQGVPLEMLFFYGGTAVCTMHFQID